MKINKIRIYSIILIGICLSIYIMPYISTNVNNTVKAVGLDLEIIESSFDYYHNNQNTNVTLEIDVKNHGPDDLPGWDYKVIFKVDNNIVGEIISTLIEDGETKSFQADYDPASTGSHSVYIYLAYENSGNPISDNDNTNNDFSSTISLSGNDINRYPEIPQKPMEIDTNMVGQTSKYGFKTIDPDNDQIEFKIRWEGGDIETVTWADSGELFEVNHVWATPGEKQISCQAMDLWGEGSDDWTDSSEELVINVIENNPPNSPSNPSPPDEGTNVPLDSVFDWEASDPDNGDILTYDIAFGTNNPPPIYQQDLSTSTFNPGFLQETTTYYWQINCWDSHGESTLGLVWKFTTKENSPPNLLNTPNPANESKDIPVLAFLNWDGTDEDNDLIYYHISLGKNSPPPIVELESMKESYNTNKLEYNTLYHWQIQAEDERGAQTKGPIWEFTTLENLPPSKPSNPFPNNQSIGLSIYTCINWSCSDPYYDQITYDIYFGTSSNPELVLSNTNNIGYCPGKLEYNTRYYWRIVVKDEYGLINSSPIWNFQTGWGSNQPPNEPYGPNPENNSNDISIDTSILSWNCEDPDGDQVRYTVYFGTTENPSKISTDPLFTTYFNLPEGLKNDETYYWRITAIDEHGYPRVGELWQFHTEKEFNTPPNVPDPPIGIQNGVINYIYVFEVLTIDPENDLVQYQIDWGDGTFNEDSGWTPFIDSGETFRIGHWWDETRTYEVRVRARDLKLDVSDWSSFVSVDIQDNNPPNIPYNPFPENNDETTYSNVDLSWSCDDPDSDNLYYDIFFEPFDEYPDSRIAHRIDETTFNPGELTRDINYYWRVIAYDEFGVRTVGPIWHFTTPKKEGNPPDQCSTPIGNTALYVGESSSFTTSAFDPENDNVRYWFNWGDGIKNPTSFDDSNKPVSLNHFWYWADTFEVKVRAEDINGNLGDWSEPLIISVTKKPLSTPFLLNPAPDEVFSEGTNIHFDWDDIVPQVGDIHYQLEWTNQPANIQTDDSYKTGYSWNGDKSSHAEILAPGVWYWHVQAYDDNNDKTEWSKQQMFIVQDDDNPIEYADLAITPNDISFSSDNPLVDEEITISATIHNIGIENTGFFNVSFRNGTQNQIGKYIENVTVSSGIEIGEKVTISIPWMVEYERATIYVEVDKDYEVFELHETNNIAFRKLGLGAETKSLNSLFNTVKGKPVLYTTDIDGKLKRVFKVNEPIKFHMVFKNHFSSWVSGEINVDIINCSTTGLPIDIFDSDEKSFALEIAPQTIKHIELEGKIDEEANYSRCGFKFTGLKFEFNLSTSDEKYSNEFGFFVDKYSMPDWFKNIIWVDTGEKLENMMDEAANDANNYNLIENYSDFCEDVREAGFNSMAMGGGDSIYNVNWYQLNAGTYPRLGLFGTWFPANNEGTGHYTNPPDKLIKYVSESSSQNSNNIEMARDVIADLVKEAHNNDLKVYMYTDTMAIYNPTELVQIIEGLSQLDEDNLKAFMEDFCDTTKDGLERYLDYYKIYFLGPAYALLKFDEISTMEEEDISNFKDTLDYFQETSNRDKLYDLFDKYDIKYAKPHPHVEDEQWSAKDLDGNPIVWQPQAWQHDKYLGLNFLNRPCYCGNGTDDRLANDDEAFSPLKISQNIINNNDFYDDPSYHYHIVKQFHYLINKYDFDMIFTDDTGRLIQTNTIGSYGDSPVLPEDSCNKIDYSSTANYLKNIVNCEDEKDINNFEKASLSNMLKHMRDQIKFSDFDGDKKALVTGFYYPPLDNNPEGEAIDWVSAGSVTDLDNTDQYCIINSLNDQILNTIRRGLFSTTSDIDESEPIKQEYGKYFAEWALLNHNMHYKPLRTDYYKTEGFLGKIPLPEELKLIEENSPIFTPLGFELFPSETRSVITGIAWANHVAIMPKWKNLEDRDPTFSNCFEMRDAIGSDSSELQKVFVNENNHQLLYHSNLPEEYSNKYCSNFDLQVEIVDDWKQLTFPYYFDPYYCLYSVPGEIGEDGRILYLANQRVFELNSIYNILNEDDTIDDVIFENKDIWNNLINSEYNVKIRIPSLQMVDKVYVLSPDFSENQEFKKELFKNIDYTIENEYISINLEDVETFDIIYITFKEIETEEDTVNPDPWVNIVTKTNNGEIQNCDTTHFPAIHQDEIHTIKTTIGANENYLEISLSHLNSDLDIHAYTPSNEHIGMNYHLKDIDTISNAYYDYSDLYEEMIIENPEEGEWIIQVLGRNIPTIFETSGLSYSLDIVKTGTYQPNLNFIINDLPNFTNKSTFEMPIKIKNNGEGIAHDIQICLYSDKINFDQDTVHLNSLSADETIESSINGIPIQEGSTTIDLNLNYQNNNGENLNKNEAIDITINPYPELNSTVSYSPNFAITTEDDIDFTCEIENTGSSVCADISYHLYLQKDDIKILLLEDEISNLNPDEQYTIEKTTRLSEGTWIAFLYVQYVDQNDVPHFAISPIKIINVKYPTIFVDLDFDKVSEYARDQNNDDIYDLYIDPNENTSLIDKKDFNNDYIDDFLIDINLDLNPDVFYDPNNYLSTIIHKIDLNNANECQYLLSVDKILGYDIFYDCENEIITEIVPDEDNKFNYKIDLDDDGKYDILYNIISKDITWFNEADEDISTKVPILSPISVTLLVMTLSLIALIEIKKKKDR